MTDDPLARLREALVGAAERRVEARRPAAVPPPRRHPLRRRGGLIALAAALIVAPAGATAAGIISFGESPESQGRKIALQALRDTEQLVPCQPVSAEQAPALSDAGPMPEITALLPALGSAVAGVDPARMLHAVGPLRGGGPVLRRTVRRFAMTDGITLTVYVQQQGGARGGVQDPPACARARRERATVLLRDRSDETRRWALRRLAEYPDTAAGLQTLMVVASVANGSSGSGSVVRPGERLRPGVLSSGGAGHGRRVYVGIAGPRTKAIVLRAERRRVLAGARTRFAVKQGFYAVVVRTGTGPVSLREMSAGGKLIRVIPLRR